MTGNQRTILEALDAFDEGLTARQLQEMTLVPEASSFRVIRGLVAANYVAKDVRGHKHTVYTITPTGRTVL